MDAVKHKVVIANNPQPRAAFGVDVGAQQFAQLLHVVPVQDGAHKGQGADKAHFLSSHAFHRLAGHVV